MKSLVYVKVLLNYLSFIVALLAMMRHPHGLAHIDMFSGNLVTGSIMMYIIVMIFWCHSQRANFFFFALPVFLVLILFSGDPVLYMYLPPYVAVVGVFFVFYYKFTYQLRKHRQYREKWHYEL